MYADWGTRVRERREQLAMTQRALAAASKVSQQMVSGVERGVLAPSDSTKWALAVALDVRPSELFPFPDDLVPAASA